MEVNIMIGIPMQFEQPHLSDNGVVPLGNMGIAACCYGVGASWGLINCCCCG
jgi:hypothetical protein